jgi:hypothetical protein
MLPLATDNQEIIPLWNADPARQKTFAANCTIERYYGRRLVANAGVFNKSMSVRPPRHQEGDRSIRCAVGNDNCDIPNSNQAINAAKSVA